MNGYFLLDSYGLVFAACRSHEESMQFPPRPKRFTV